jgi:hypothetical protein
MIAVRAGITGRSAVAMVNSSLAGAVSASASTHARPITQILGMVTRFRLAQLVTRTLRQTILLPNGCSQNESPELLHDVSETGGSEL